MPMMVGERRGEDRSRTVRYGGTVRTPRSPVSTAQSALAAEANGDFRAEGASALGPSLTARRVLPAIHHLRPIRVSGAGPP
jgi:hypothetical protein